LRRLGKIRLAQGKPDLAAPLFKRALAQYRVESHAAVAKPARVAVAVSE